MSNVQSVFRPPLSAVSNAAAHSSEIESLTARLGDVQSLVSSIVADMDAVGAELRALRPPERAANPQEMTKMLRIYEEKKTSLLAKLAALNTKLEVAYRSIGEIEASIAKAKDKLQVAQRQDAERLTEQLKEQRERLDAAVGGFLDETRDSAKANRMEFHVARGKVGIHLDGDGRADGETAAVAFVVDNAQARGQIERFQLSSLDVLPAGAHLDRELVTKLSDNQLEVRGTPPPDHMWSTLRSMLRNGALPPGHAAAEAWYRMADTIGMERGNFVLKILDVSNADPRLGTIAADFQRDLGARGVTVTPEQADDFAWRLLAGRELGQPAVFLRDAQAPWRRGLDPNVIFDVISSEQPGSQP
jgi:hypothetical protein